MQFCKQIISSCDSVIPDPIFEAFALADSRLKMLLNKNAVRRRIHDEFEKNMNPLNIIYSAVYSDLYTRISKENRWSWKKLNPEEIVENALENIQKIHLSSNNFFVSTTRRPGGTGSPPYSTTLTSSILVKNNIEYVFAFK